MWKSIKEVLFIALVAVVCFVLFVACQKMSVEGGPGQ